MLPYCPGAMERRHVLPRTVPASTRADSRSRAHIEINPCPPAGCLSHESLPIPNRLCHDFRFLNGDDIQFIELHSVEPQTHHHQYCRSVAKIPTEAQPSPPLACIDNLNNETEDQFFPNTKLARDARELGTRGTVQDRRAFRVKRPGHVRQQSLARGCKVEPNWEI